MLLRDPVSGNHRNGGTWFVATIYFSLHEGLIKNALPEPD